MAASPKPLTQPARNVAARLPGKLQAAWQILSECSGEIPQSVPTGQLAPSDDLKTIRGWYEEASRILLVEPVQKFLRLQPLRRTLEALRACDQ
jgi:hypothetical protein